MQSTFSDSTYEEYKIIQKDAATVNYSISEFTLMDWGKPQTLSQDS